MSTRHPAAIAIIIIAAFVLSTAPAVAQEQMDQRLQTLQKASRIFENGLKLFNEKKIAEARKQFGDALNIHSSYPEAELYLGMCDYEEGNYESALAYVKSAEEMYVKWHAINFDIQVKQFDDSRITLDRKKEMLNASVGAASKSSTGNNMQVDILKREISQLEQMKRPQPTEAVVPTEFDFQEGNCYLKMKKWNDALSAYLRAVEADPNHGKAHNNIAFIYSLAKQYGNSWKHLQLAKANGVNVPDQIWNDIKAKAEAEGQ